MTKRRSNHGVQTVTGSPAWPTESVPSCACASPLMTPVPPMAPAPPAAPAGIQLSADVPYVTMMPKSVILAEIFAGRQVAIDAVDSAGTPRRFVTTSAPREDNVIEAWDPVTLFATNIAFGNPEDRMAGTQTGMPSDWLPPDAVSPPAVFTPMTAPIPAPTPAPTPAAPGTYVSLLNATQLEEALGRAGATPFGFQAVDAQGQIHAFFANSWPARQYGVIDATRSDTGENVNVVLPTETSTGAALAPVHRALIARGIATARKHPELVRLAREAWNDRELLTQIGTVLRQAKTRDALLAAIDARIAAIGGAETGQSSPGQLPPPFETLSLHQAIATFQRMIPVYESQAIAFGGSTQGIYFRNLAQTTRLQLQGVQAQLAALNAAAIADPSGWPQPLPTPPTEMTPMPPRPTGRQAPPGPPGHGLGMAIPNPYGGNVIRTGPGTNHPLAAPAGDRHLRPGDMFVILRKGLSSTDGQGGWWWEVISPSGTRGFTRAVDPTTGQDNFQTISEPQNHFCGIFFEGVVAIPTAGGGGVSIPKSAVVTAPILRQRAEAAKRMGQPAAIVAALENLARTAPASTDDLKTGQMVRVQLAAPRTFEVPPQLAQQTYADVQVVACGR